MHKNWVLNSTCPVPKEQARLSMVLFKCAQGSTVPTCSLQRWFMSPTAATCEHGNKFAVGCWLRLIKPYKYAEGRTHGPASLLPWSFVSLWKPARSPLSPTRPPSGARSLPFEGPFWALRWKCIRSSIRECIKKGWRASLVNFFRF